MSLHDKIMNIRSEESHMLYKLGHKDARHAAGELAARQDAVVAEMTRLLKYIIEPSDRWAIEFLGSEVTRDIRRVLDEARAAR